MDNEAKKIMKEEGYLIVRIVSYIDNLISKQLIWPILDF